MDDLNTRVARLLWSKLPAPHTCPDEIDEAARAVVALVLDEAAKAAFTAATSSAPATERKKIAAAIRALGDKS